MIHLLDFVMGKATFIVLAVAVGTKLMAVVVGVWPSTVQFIMVVDAGLSFMVIFIYRGVPLRGHCLVL